MNAARTMLLVLAAVCLSAVPALAAPAEAQLSTGTIQGKVFLDLNQNGLFDYGEPPLSFMQLEISNGESIVHVVSAADGTFSIPVSDGLWRVIIHVPDGMKVINDATRQVNIGSDAATQALMNFAVSAISSFLDGPQSWLQVALISSDVNGAELVPNPVIDLGSDAGITLSEEEMGTDEVSSPIVTLLPVSGGSFPLPVWMMLVISLAVTFIGTSLILIGRLVRGRQ